MVLSSFVFMSPMFYSLIGSISVLLSCKKESYRFTFIFLSVGNVVKKIFLSLDFFLFTAFFECLEERGRRIIHSAWRDDFA